jgi:molybdate transport system substrate-binding protein
MKYMAALAVAFGCSGIALLGSTQTNAAEVKLLAALGFQQVLEDLGPKFQKASGHTLQISYGTMGGVVKRVQAGETADLIIIPQQGIDGLMKAGKTVGNVTVLARSGVSVAIRKGASKPDISTSDALRRALLAAKSITYTDPAAGGASGIHFAQVLEKLGIASEMKPKTILAKGGIETGELVAQGKAELGINQLQILIAVPGIDIAGPLPGNLQATTVFAAAVMNNAQAADAAKALISFLRTEESGTVIKAKGMEQG